MAPSLMRRRLPYFVLGALVVLAAISGAALGYFLRLDLPDVRALEDYRPPEMSSVLAADGSLVANFAEERRTVIGYRDLPETLLHALIATEDASFFRHPGIDLKAIARALWHDLRQRRMAQGASTLTQQLARNLFLKPDKTIRRKLQEALLAMEIERQYTKQEILRFYCNQIYTGHGRYGVEAASRFYFDSSARDLTLVEAATLAGLIQRPEGLSPIKHPERARRRRNYVLDRMVDVGYLPAPEAAAAKQLPLEVSAKRGPTNRAPYFVEEVRRWLQARYGSSSLYKEGLEVRTTLDQAMQSIARDAVELGLRELDKRQGWRGVSQRLPEGEALDTWAPDSWQLEIEIGSVHDGLVIAVDPEQATVRVAQYTGGLREKQIRWTREKRPDKLLAPGDLIRVRLTAVDDGGSATLTLEQAPLVEGALIALDPSTGAVHALVGGFDFARSEFDRAIQARRQTGSAFKPFVFVAALAQGWSLADTLLDEPTVFLDPRQPDPYQPENYTNKYHGTVTLRTALERSANIATVKLLEEIGYEPVIETARRLGITSDLQPFPSLALGAFGISLIELTAAYGAFANNGVLVEPHLLEEVHNANGDLIERIEPRVTDAVRPEIAYLVNRVLRGVITDGTGRAAAGLGFPLAGKTGTTDNNTDAWFMGYSPDLAVGVWVGFDEPRSLGSRETGARAALPIWRHFMEKVLEGRPSPADFTRPAGISIVAVDRASGLKSNLGADCQHVISEVFVAGTEPTEYCSTQRHRQLALPYPFQRYPLNDDGELVIPSNDLDRLLANELQVYLIDGGRRLEAYTADGIVSLPVRRGRAVPREATPDRILEHYDVSEWLGHDGRTAEIRWLN